MRSRVTTVASLIVFLSALISGIRLAWAADTCAGTATCLDQNTCWLSCLGDCDQGDRCTVDPSVNNLWVCICGSESPPDAPCWPQFLERYSIGGQWRFKFTCGDQFCASPADCEKVFTGTLGEDASGYLTGSGSVTCPCN